MDNKPLKFDYNGNLVVSLSKETENKILQKMREVQEEILTDELIDKLVRETLTSNIKGRVTEILQDKEMRNKLYDKVLPALTKLLGG